jgi:CHASE2 domain-containing sensor protein
MMKQPRIFISYRRADSIVHGKLLYDKLAEHFGRDAVFMDKEEIDLGDDFARIIDERVGSSTVLLAVIGPTWLTLVDDTGRRRLDLPNDYVRHEIASALARQIPVIPVLVGGAHVPAKDDLPAGIAELASRNAHEIRDSSLEEDIDTLIAHLAGERKGFRQAFGDLTRRFRLRRIALVVVPASVLIVFFGAWVSLFDYFTLDAKIESYTMGLGSLFVGEPPSPAIAIVAITTESERHFQKGFDSTWRHEHALLIRALSKAGAKVVAFDLVLEDPSPFDGELVAAIHAARNSGTAVFFGTRGESPAIPDFENAVSGLGHTCAGSRLGYATTVPLVAGSNERKVAALALLAATGGGVVEDLDWEHRQIILRSPEGQLRRIGVTDYAVVSELQRTCRILKQGDLVPQLIVQFLPVENYRSAALRHRFEDVVRGAGDFGADAFRGKIVLVGRESDSDTISVFSGLRPERRYGFETHADILNTLLRGLRIHPLNPWGQFLLMLVMGALGAPPRFLQSLRQPFPRRLYCAGIVASYLGLTIICYLRYQVLLNTLYHISAFFMAYSAMGKAARRLGL